MSALAIPYDKLWNPSAGGPISPGLYGSAAINVSAIGATLIVAAVALRSIWVLSYEIVTTAGNSVTLEDSTGVVYRGPMPFIANGGIATPYNAAGHFRIPVGRGLSIGCTSALQTGGGVCYVVV